MDARFRGALKLSGLANQVENGQRKQDDGDD